MIHMGYPRFRYGNYWFLIVDPWPEFWSENWYADDDVYVDYNDGYYLQNRRHPGVSIAISVSMSSLPIKRPLVHSMGVSARVESKTR